MERKNVSSIDYLLLIPGVGFILLFIGSSIFITITQSFGVLSVTGKSQFTIENWKAIFHDKESLDSILFSLKIGLLSSVGTLLFAFPIALFLRKGGAGKRFLASLIKIPLFIPALVAAFLIINLISYHGIVNEALLALGIIKKPLRMLNDKFGWGVIVIQVWKNLPFVLLILSSSLAQFGMIPSMRLESRSGDLFGAVPHLCTAGDARHSGIDDSYVHQGIWRFRHNERSRADLSAFYRPANAQYGDPVSGVG